MIPPRNVLNAFFICYTLSLKCFDFHCVHCAQTTTAVYSSIGFIWALAATALTACTAGLHYLHTYIWHWCVCMCVRISCVNLRWWCANCHLCWFQYKYIYSNRANVCLWFVDSNICNSQVNTSYILYECDIFMLSSYTCCGT